MNTITCKCRNDLFLGKESARTFLTAMKRLRALKASQKKLHFRSSYGEALVSRSRRDTRLRLRDHRLARSDLDDRNRSHWQNSPVKRKKKKSRWHFYWSFRKGWRSEVWSVRWILFPDNDAFLLLFFFLSSFLPLSLRAKLVGIGDLRGLPGSTKRKKHMNEPPDK